MSLFFKAKGLFDEEKQLFRSFKPCFPASLCPAHSHSILLLLNSQSASSMEEWN